MATVSPESSLFSLKKKKKIDMMGELVEGHRSASQLKFLLQKPFEDHVSLSAHQHLAVVLRSFTHSLSLLTSPSSPSQEEEDDVHVVVQNLVVPGENEPPPPDASETRGRSAAPPTTKSRRGCYKRRRTEQTWTVVSSTADDNHAWRKYGQKEILNFKFPRSYMRCTRKYEQGCRAVKQVQRIQENPEMYQITYIGHHTCKDILKTPRVVTHSDDASSNWESFFADSNHQHHPIKREEMSMMTASDDFTDSSSLDPSLWSDLKDLSEAAMVPNLASDDDNNNNNADTTVYSCSASLDFGLHDPLHYASHDFLFDMHDPS